MQKQENPEASENMELYSALGKSFELRRQDIISFAEIKKQVEAVIRELLNKNMEKLLSVLYRIDVDQKKTDSIFSIGSKDDMARLLAEAVIERQLEKIKTRKKYREEIHSERNRLE